MVCDRSLQGTEAALEADGVPKAACATVLTFGKHEGEALADIAGSDPGYIRWLAREARDDSVREAAQATLDARSDDSKPDGDLTLSFGKHQGEALADVADSDPGYVRWLAREARDDFVRKAAQATLDARSDDSKPDGDLTLSFGKHQGKTLADVADSDPSYVRWLAREARDDSVREAAQATIEAKSIGSDIDVSLTFGKWEGWSSAELAQAGYVGRNYLSWGSTKLRSPVWRQRFKAALRQYNPEDMDVALAARAIQEGDGISWEDARRLAVAEKQRVVRSQKADRQCREAKEWLNRQLRELGISDQALGPISDYIQQGGMDEINRRVESGQVRSENVNRMLFEAVVGVFESKMDEIVRS